MVSIHTPKLKIEICVYYDMILKFSVAIVEKKFVYVGLVGKR